MPRYFFEISYDGTHYSGWQRQPNAPTVQQEIEEKLSKIVREKVGIMGCGRTDAGVHASQFFFHADLNADIDLEQLQFKLNHAIEKDISCHQIIAVADNAHTRFDATHRSYIYHLHTIKDPFKKDYSTYYPTARNIDFAKLQEVAAVILQYQDFASFCKSRTDVKTTLCDLQESEWRRDEDTRVMTYHIRANRFLRGMVRLIVGTTINVALGKLSVEQLKEAIEKKAKPPYAHSAPSTGLFLSEVKYPYL